MKIFLMLALSIAVNVVVGEVSINSPTVTLTDPNGQPIEGVSYFTSNEKAMEEASRSPAVVYKLTKPDATITVKGIQPAPTPDPTSDPDRAPSDLRDPANDAEMIQAILKAAPQQHATKTQFKKIPGSEIDVLLKCADYPEFGEHIACFKPQNAFLAWTGGAWNFKDWEFTQPAGGGHGDYGGNEVYLAELKITESGDLATKWSMPIKPSPLRDVDCGAPVSGPGSSHTYATPVYVEKQDEYWHQTTIIWPASTKCQQRGQDLTVGEGSWTHDSKTWTKRSDGKLSFGRACYHRNANKIYMRQQSNAGAYYEFDAGKDYAVTVTKKNQWLSAAGTFDAAMDQIRDVCYWSDKDRGLIGAHHDPATGEITQVFNYKDPAGDRIPAPSLSVEHSTGNLVTIGVNGYAKLFNVATGVMTDISNTTGILGNSLIYGKVDLIEKIPCTGIGTSDPREGIYLVTLPANVCGSDIPTPDPVPEPDPEPAPIPPTVDSAFLDRCKETSVVFCDPLSTHGPYRQVNGELQVLTNPDGSQGVGTGRWWRNWRGYESWTDAYAGYDPQMDALKLVMGKTASQSGSFKTNFSKDLKTQFKEGDSFSIEFQVRYNCDFIFKDCDPDSPTYQTLRKPIINTAGRTQAGKVAIIGEGDIVQGESAPACEHLQIVPYMGKGHTFGLFHSCGRYARLDESGDIIGGSTNYNWQMGGDYECRWMPDNKTRTFQTWDWVGPNCAQAFPDQWMTFKMHITVGTWQDVWTGPKTSHITMSLAYGDEPLKVVIDTDMYIRTPTVPYVGFGSIWLQLHSTDAVKDSDRLDNIVWYRNMIIKREL